MQPILMSSDNAHLPPQHPLEHLAAIINSSDDAIVSKDLNGVIRSWNPAAERMFGYTAQEAIGQSITIIIPTDRLSEEHHVLSQIRSGHAVAHFETLRRRKDGTLIPISLTVSPVRDAEGRIIGASKIARDISEQVRAQRALAELHEQQRRARERALFLAHLGGALAGSLDHAKTLTTIAELAVPRVADWCAIDVPAEGGRLTRVAFAHVDPKKSTEPEAVPPPDDPTAPPRIKEVIASGRSVLIEEPVGGISSYLCVPLRAHGKILGALTLVSDESGRRYSDDDLQFAEDIAVRGALALDNAHAYEQAQKANRIKDEFLAMLSHELRTPLNAMRGWTSILRTQRMDEQRMQHGLTIIDRNITAQTQLVEDLLDISRIVTGTFRLNVQTVDLEPLVRAAVEGLRPAAESKSIRIRQLLDSSAGPISADPTRLQQVVWNLLSNSIKFTHKQGRVDVELRRVDSHVELIVADTGEGIDADILPFVFDRFRQADSSTTRPFGGLGLGLAIVKHVVELHGGSVHAASPGRGQGATFTIALPLTLTRRMPPAPRLEGSEASGSSKARLDGLRVLCVDDDRDACELLSVLLGDAGATIRSSTTVADAMGVIEAWHPDVVVSDIEMPAEDGYSLGRRLRAHDAKAGRRTVAIAVTAYASSEDRLRALTSGFQSHIPKPIDPMELVTVIASLTGRDVPDA